MPAQEPITNALTIDVEDWYHGFLPKDQWEQAEPRLSIGLMRILDLLDRYRVKATFFVLGIVVEQWRSLLGAVADAGHEIAAHGFDHTPVYRLSPRDFAQDLLQTLYLLRCITDEPIQGYRAPYFSITKQNFWALSIVAECGLRYDTSIVPAHNPRYGIPDANRFPHKLTLHPPTIRTNLREYPISTMRIGSYHLPFSGGFYARFLPYPLISRAIRQLNQVGQPAIFYLHPWEFDPDHPRVSEGVAPLYRMTHYYRLDSMAIKLERLLQEFQFVPISALEQSVLPNVQDIHA
ncbi:polysaccharide deacetylase family protein [Chloroflexi bacterium TSY]|nr:polysaccharide deacetylase family protein [Chloroflexi bacterium TSY]